MYKAENDPPHPQKVIVGFFPLLSLSQGYEFQVDCMVQKD